MMPGELQVTNHQLRNRGQSKLAVYFPCQVRPSPSSPTPGHSIAGRPHPTAQALKPQLNGGGEARGQCCVDELGFVDTRSPSPCLNLSTLPLIAQVLSSCWQHTSAPCAPPPIRTSWAWVEKQAYSPISHPKLSQGLLMGKCMAKEQGTHP